VLSGESNNMQMIRSSSDVSLTNNAGRCRSRNRTAHVPREVMGLVEKLLELRSQAEGCNCSCGKCICCIDRQISQLLKEEEKQVLV